VKLDTADNTFYAYVVSPIISYLISARSNPLCVYVSAGLRSFYEKFSMAFLIRGFLVLYISTYNLLIRGWLVGAEYYEMSTLGRVL